MYGFRQLVKSGYLLGVRQVGSMEILDEGQEQRVLVRSTALDGPDRGDPRASVRAPAALTADELVTGFGAAHHDGLELAPAPDRPGQIVQRALVDKLPRAQAVGANRVD